MDSQLNPCASPYSPPLCVFSDGIPTAFLINPDPLAMLRFDRNTIREEELFDPRFFPVSTEDAEELDAVEQFNLEMARLEQLEEVQGMYNSVKEYLKTKKSTTRLATAADLLAGKRTEKSSSGGRPMANIPSSKLKAKPCLSKTHGIKQPQKVTILSA